MHDDPLSAVLEHAGVSGTVFCRAQLGAPWSVSTRGSGPEGSERPAIFHVIVRGAGFVRVPDSPTGREATAWRAGDVVFLPHGDAHVLASEPELAATPIATLAAPAGDDGLPCVTHGGGGPVTSILCGTVKFSADADELLRPQLPALLHLRCAEGPAAAWLDATLRLLGAEVSGALPGAESVVARLAEVLFVQVLRAWIREAQGADAGWLAALGDPQLARALGRIHDAPAEDWTAEALARHAGMSRSAFYKRFNRVVGEPPAAYLTRWRMHLARRALRRGASLSETAVEVGYKSDAAFSRAFKRAVGASPRDWRAALAPA